MKSFLFADNDFGTLAFFVWPIMTVCHIYFVVSPIFWNAIIEIV